MKNHTMMGGGDRQLWCWAQARLIVLLLVAVSPLGVAAQQSEVPRIVVSGHGSVEMAPDMALLTLTVTREEDTARAALDANSMAMQALLAAMEERGIDPRDLQTTHFAIQPRLVYPPRQTAGQGKPPHIAGYTVRNTLSVRVRDIKQLGSILDEAVTLGVNDGGNIRFANADPGPALSQARTLAVQDALARANTLAAAAGVQLGPILTLTEPPARSTPVPMARMEMSLAADAVPVASGENSYAVTVELTVAIR